MYYEPHMYPCTSGSHVGMSHLSIENRHFWTFPWLVLKMAIFYRKMTHSNMATGRTWIHNGAHNTWIESS